MKFFAETFAFKFMMQFLLENFRHFTSKVTKAAPIFKSVSRHQKENHRPIYMHQSQNLMLTQFSNCSHNFRMLAELSNCLHNFQIVHTTFDLLTQLSNCLDKILSKFQCGFWKGVGAQHCLFLMIEK